jgi:hypothetical protein
MTGHDVRELDGFITDVGGDGFLSAAVIAFK